MNDAAKTAWQWPRLKGRFRNRFAASLGVRSERKTEIYISLSKASTLKDLNYWLQLLFAAGVATLGLVLDSPAVIIGAMLISPLMGPILSAGLALATGDLILGVRAAASLGVSCLTAIGFSVFLVGLLPFKEMTGEIAARTRPNTLDLAVALFSGAIGSIAISKKSEGVVTSIPGVAIAVALMPPLCVVGYGIGLAVSLNGTDGLRVASGGGLLFLTNLVAITFMTMIVFLILRIDAAPVPEEIRQWRRTDAESEWVRYQLERLHVSDKFRQIGGLPGRLLVILIPLLLILIPLSRSFSQLKQQYSRQRQENNIRRIATDYWQQQFAKLPSGEQRSVLDRIAISESEGKLTLALRVFTSKPYSAAQRNEFSRLVAARLGRAGNSVDVQLLEIPTAAGMLAARAREEKPVEAPPTIDELRARFSRGVQTAFQGVRLPPTAQLYSYRVGVNPAGPSQVELVYLAERDIEADARELITEDIRARLSESDSVVNFERIPAAFALGAFRRNQSVPTSGMTEQLDRIGELLQRHSSLRAEIITSVGARERENMDAERAQALSDYLGSKWKVGPERIMVTAGTDPAASAVIRFQYAPEK